MKDRIYYSALTMIMLIIVCLSLNKKILATSTNMTELTPSFPSKDFPMILPELEDSPVVGKEWKLEKNYTVYLESKLGVNIPLEIISDVDVDALVLDEEEVEVPFELKVNKTPKKQNYYKLRYSETEIDIDGDGKKDTFIYSPKYINQKVIKNNYVKVQGKNIGKDGKYNKKVYIIVEVNE